MKKLTLRLLPILAFLLFWDISAYAELLGDRIKPFLSVKEIYDSNIFKVKDEEQLRSLIGDDQLSDFVTIFTLGTGLNFQISRQEIDILLKKDFLRYGHYTSQNAQQDEVKGNISLRILDRISAKITGDYTKSLEPREYYRTQEKVERTTKVGGASLGYDLPSNFSIHAGFRQEEVDFSIPELENRERTDKSYSGTLAYSPSTETKFEIAYERHDFDYEIPQYIGGRLVSNDSTGDAIKAIFTRKFSPKTAISLSAGYLWRKFDEFSARDFQGTTGKAEVNYGITEKLVLYAMAERKLYEELFLDQTYSVNESFGLGAAYKPTEKIETFVYGSTSKRSYKGEADIITTTYPPRKDRTNEIKTGMGWYPVIRLGLTLLYRYTTRNSNLDMYDYRSHGVELGVSYKF
ncbi:MAG: outer membrane beta-barrel protein [Nitrospirae bacterium]|nr:outer membrane beta-barrel protein [Nitrospirota bacterium]